MILAMTWIYGPATSVAFVLFAVSSIWLLVVSWRRLRQAVKNAESPEAGIEITWKLSTADRWLLFVFIVSGIALCYGIPNHL